MKLLDLSLLTPAENLACDEALLESVEEDGGESVLRFWESPAYFVALGYTDATESEVDVAACRALNVPILRRPSGGGTVLQGPGCLNYALILPIENSGPLSNLSDTNRVIMQRHRDVMQSLLIAPVTVEGYTDLALNGLKFSGNAQRRKRRTLLFHGTFLLDFDLSLVSRLLRMPSKQPAYRQERGHGDFLTNLDVEPDAIKSALKQAWNATQPLDEIPRERIATLAREKYESDEWNFKF